MNPNTSSPPLSSSPPTPALTPALALAVQRQVLLYHLRCRLVNDRPHSWAYHEQRAYIECAIPVYRLLYAAGWDVRAMVTLWRAAIGQTPS